MSALRRAVNVGCLVACVSSVALLAAGCGDRIPLPAEPEDSGGFTGEIAYKLQYRWLGMPTVTDMVLASGILFAIEDSAHVRAYLSDKADPVINQGFNFPDSIVVGDDVLTVPVQLAVGTQGKTLWIAFAGDSLVQEFRIASPPQATDRWVAADSVAEFGGLAADNDYVYIADAERNEISKFEPSEDGGSLVAVLATEGTGDTFVQEPRGLFFFGDSLLVADAANSRVQVIHAGQPHTGRGEVRDPTGEPLGLIRPIDVWMDRAGIFYVAERGRVTQITPLGIIKEVVTEQDPESAAFPSSVVSNTTQVWVPDPDQACLTVYQINTVAEELP